MAIIEPFDPKTDHRLPDGYEIRVYEWGGIDARASSDLPFRTVASTPESCAALAAIAAKAAGPGPIPTLEAILAQDPVTLAARIVADLVTLAKIMNRRGAQEEVQRLAVAHGVMECLLARAREDR